MNSPSAQKHLPKMIKLGECELDPSSGNVVRGDHSIKLDPKSIDVLLFLVELKGQLVSRDQLMEAAWKGLFVSDSQLSKHIAEIRRALGDTEKPRRFVETLPKRGYRLICDTQIILYPTDVLGSPSLTNEKANRTVQWKAILASAAAVLVLVVLIAYINEGFGPGQSAEENLQSATEIASQAELDTPSIAVLPFLDISQEQDQEYLADGVAGELLNLLAQIPNLRVVSRTSSFYFKDNVMDVRAIAERLNVHHVLEGSIRRYGERIQVSVQLIDTELDSLVWSQAFDGNFEDIFSIQNEVAASVVDRFKLTLVGEMPRRETGNSEAYALFLQARFLQQQLNPESTVNAITLYQQVLEIEPNHVGALAALGLIYIDQAMVGAISVEDGQTLSIGFLNRALEIDPNYALIYLGLAFQVLFDGNLETGFTYFSRALELAPADPDIIFESASALFVTYQYEKALQFLYYLEARDPLNPAIYATLARIYALTSQWEQAEEQARIALRLSPEHNDAPFSLGLALLHKGDPSAALAAFQQDQRIESIVGITIAHHALGNEVEFKSSLDELIAGWGQVSPSAVADVYAYIGDNEAAFEWLDKSLYFDLRSMTLHTSPLLIDLHDDPRWNSLLTKMGTSRDQLEAYNLRMELPQMPLEEMGSE